VRYFSSATLDNSRVGSRPYPVKAGTACYGQTL
jgi:hypothetical protein